MYTKSKKRVSRALSRPAMFFLDLNYLCYVYKQRRKYKGKRKVNRKKKNIYTPGKRKRKSTHRRGKGATVI